VREIEPGRRIVAVLDVDPGWERVTIEGHHLELCTPGAEVAERLAELKPARIVVNLLAPTVLETLSVLRSGGSTASFWGCLASPESDRALALGMIEPATRPLDCDAILTALGAHAARGTRVVTAGADVDALMSLRQAMSRRGMSVSMAWDAKQATELLGVVRPEVVVVDLDLPRRDGFSIVARLGSLEPAPVAVIVAAPGDLAAGFAAALGDPTNVGQAVPLEQLLTSLVARSEAPAERRPQKLRALARK
jgi:CheY-like chemotaxis protein